MTKTKQELEKYLLELYEHIFNKGHSYDDALAIVGHIVRLYWITGFQEDTFDDFDTSIMKIAKDYFKKDELNEYGYLDFMGWKESYLSVVKRWEEKQAPVEKKSTSVETREIMQSFARMLPSGLTYIDPAIGTGQLLIDIDNDIIGQDIDFRLSIVADTLVRIGKTHEIGIKTGDSLGTKYDIFKNSGIYIYDPPIGKKQKNPEHWNNKDTNSILGEGHRDTNDTEIIFLVNFLLYANDDSYFICKMPTNFLTARNKELDALRKYLIINNLMGVIKSADGFVVLVGSKNAQYHKTITTISLNNLFFEKNENIKLLDAISNEVISEDNELKLYLSSNLYEIYDKTNLINEIEGNIIKLPLAQFDAKEYEPPSKYFNQIVDLEHKIVTQMKNLRTKFIEYELDKVENINEIFPEEEIPENINIVSKTIETKVNVEKPEIIIKNWYESSTTEEAKAITYIKNKSDFSENSGLLKSISLSFDEYKTFFNYLNIIKNRLSIETSDGDENSLNVLKINMEENIIKTNTNKDILMPISFDLNQRIEHAKSILSERQLKLYNLHCSYWFDFANFNIIEFKQYSKSQLYSTFTTLNKLGLIINKYEETIPAADEIKVELEIYDQYRPYHPLIVGGID